MIKSVLYDEKGGLISYNLERTAFLNGKEGTDDFRNNNITR